MFHKAPPCPPLKKRLSPEFSEDLSRHRTLVFLPLLSLFLSSVSRCPRVIHSWSGAAEWVPVFALSLSCDLWSVWTAWPTEAASRRQPRDRAEDETATFNCKSPKWRLSINNKHLWHVTSIRGTCPVCVWYMWYAFTDKTLCWRQNISLMPRLTTHTLTREKLQCGLKIDKQPLPPWPCVVPPSLLSPRHPFTSAASPDVTCFCRSLLSHRGSPCL